MNKSKVFIIFIVLYTISIACSNNQKSVQEISGKYYQENVDWVYFDFDKNTKTVTHHINDGVTQFTYKIENKQIVLTPEESDINSFVFTIIDANALELIMMGERYLYIKKQE